MSPSFARLSVLAGCMLFLLAAPLQSQQAQAPQRPENCDAIIKTHGFLSRAQFQCGFGYYSNDMMLAARECSSGRRPEQVSKLLRQGMETFDADEREMSHDALCQDILQKFPKIVGATQYHDPDKKTPNESSAYKELEALESEVRTLLDQRRLREAKVAAARMQTRAQQVVGKNHKAYVISLQAMGLVQSMLGESSEAVEALREALPLAETLWGKDSPMVGEILNNLAEALRRMGRTEAAEQVFRRALAVHERNHGTDSERYAETEMNLAASLPQEKSPEAERLFRHAYSVLKARAGDKDPRTGTVLVNIAVLQRRQGKLAECEQTLKMVLKQISTERDRDARAHALNELADVLFAQRKFAEAKGYFEQALELDRELFGDRHYRVAWLYSRLANIAFATAFDPPPRDGERARSSEAVGQRLVDQSKLGLALRRKAYASMQGYEHVLPMGRVTDAGIEGAQEAREVQFAYLFALDTARKLKLESEVALDRESFNLGQVLQESWVADALKLLAARLATENSERSLELRGLQDAIVKRREIELASIKDLEAGNLASLSNVRTELASLDAEIQSRLAAVDAKVPQYSALIDSRPLAVEEVQSYLADDEAIVSILAENAHLNIWVVTKTALRWVSSLEKTVIEDSTKIDPSRLGSSADIDRLQRDVNMLRCGLDVEAWTKTGSLCPGLLHTTYTLADYEAGKPLPFRSDVAYDLYQLLFKEVADLLVGKRLLIVPSGALSGIPIQVLVSSAPPPGADFRSVKWMARDHAISVLPSVSALKALRSVARPSRATARMAGFGNPLLDGYDKAAAERVRRAGAWQSCDAVAAAEAHALRKTAAAGALHARNGAAFLQQLKAQNPLPETAYELCQVARLLGADQQEVRLGARATESEVKALSRTGALANYRVLHFATHGVMAGELIGAPEPGLIFTPPQTASTEDDGFLTASEIAGLRLDADWVILSACNTAAGDSATGSALSGLARAFFYAGARSVLVTHWSIDTDAAVELVTASLSELSGGGKLGRDEALRRAMMTLVDRGGNAAHPAYWAPFSLVGDVAWHQ